VATKKARRVTVEDLLGKARRTKEIKFDSNLMLFQALGGDQYDELLDAHPPTKAQQADGMIWNTTTFPAALVSACSVEPKIDEEMAKSLWTSTTWSRGELMGLFAEVMSLNSAGLDIPFTATV
jgi:hypothetical protein